MKEFLSVWESTINGRFREVYLSVPMRRQRNRRASRNVASPGTDTEVPMRPEESLKKPNVPRRSKISKKRKGFFLGARR
jgi:hypothetical protein